MNHTKKDGNEKMALAQKAKSGYRNALIITTLVAAIYLAVIFISSI